MYNNLFILFITLFASAFFSASETAFTALSDMQVRILQAKYPLRGALVAYLFRHSSLLLASILIGNNIANLIFTVASTSLTLSIFGNDALALMTGVLVLLTLIFGEITPKQLAIQYNQQYVVLCVFPLFFFYLLFTPLSFVLSLFSKIFNKPLIDSDTSHTSGLSKEHFIKLFYQARATGILNSDNVHMVTRILSISELTVDQIITHRTNIASLSSNNTVESVRKAIEGSEHAYFPVYQNEDKEHIIGIVESKRIESYLANPLADISTYMHLPIFVPTHKTIESMLETFRHSSLSIAIVLDEYGGLEGLLTLSDIIDYISKSVDNKLGQQSLSHESRWIRVDNNNFIISGTVDISEIAEFVGVPLDNSMEVRTLGGYLQQQLGKLPSVQVSVSTEYGTMKILDINNNRITSVLWSPSISTRE